MPRSRRPTLYLAPSQHGYGHATRLAAIAAEVQRLLPDVRLIVAGEVPRQLLAGYIGGAFEQHRVALDAGVVQPDSLTIDIAATLRAAQRIRHRQHEIVAAELAFIRRAGVSMILADIPPLAAPLAEAAGVPCWMVSNFGWDYIYAAWGQPFADLTAWIAECYGRCARLFRLPFHEPMASFATITDVGLTGGRPRWPPAVLATELGIDHPRERVALVTFGGFGRHRIPYQALRARRDWLFVVFDPQAPEGGNIVPLRDMRLRPVDVMPLCGRLIAKPGFSTFSEAIRHGVPIVTMRRPDFAEAAILVAGMAAVVPHQLVDLDAFLAGDWSFLDQPLSLPTSDATVAMNGSETIARLVVEALVA